ncbi:MBL fold metallo-hydrolase [Litchfieldia salsa]|uniref:Ribonuclease BN, tRNA processing enzyme n=1 Tax=Litchfieldia salsa TaxID=930152 RepID=A0A1H0UPB9_9BACI|nr:MBL fold metallo-hydrolase [Litchfieldia salsa]SDP67940.1 Ribonuclease BN, tRNA processing enzyme [Litchfieldia salsa]
MKVTVVGYWGGYPGVNEATSGYLFEHEGFRLLVDCGSGVLAQLQNYIEISELDAVIISHYHHDHIADIGPLQYARLISNYLNKSSNNLPIYGHEEDLVAFSKLTYKNITSSEAYIPEQVLHIGPFAITFMKTKHPAICYAMRIVAGEHTIVFTGDSSYVEGFIPFSVNADLLICECNLYGDQEGAEMGHMNSIEAGKIAEEAKVKNLLLTHLPHYGNHEILQHEAASIFNGNLFLARQGFIFEP